MNTMEYRYKNKHKDVEKINLHFVNIKELKYAYKKNINKLS